MPSSFFEIYWRVVSTFISKLTQFPFVSLNASGRLSETKKHSSLQFRCQMFKGCPLLGPLQNHSSTVTTKLRSSVVDVHYAVKTIRRSSIRRPFSVTRTTFVYRRFYRYYYDYFLLSTTKITFNSRLVILHGICTFQIRDQLVFISEN